MRHVQHISPKRPLRRQLGEGVKPLAPLFFEGRTCPIRTGGVFSGVPATNSRRCLAAVVRVFASLSSQSCGDLITWRQ